MGQRLPDVVELVTRKFREIATVIKHPGAVFKRVAWKKGRSLYENARLPGGDDSSESSSAQSSPSSSPSSSTPPLSTPPLSPSSSPLPSAPPLSPPPLSPPSSSPPRSPNSRPLWDDGPITGDRFNDFFEDELGDVEPFEESYAAQYIKTVVPLLTSGDPLNGSQYYRYTIGQVLRKYDWVRWYSAINQATNEAVVIQEYLLPQSEFNRQEIEERQRAFSRLISLNRLSINGPGEGRDFRIVRLVEAFSQPPKHGSDEAGRCYLVTKPLPERSLRDYLAQQGKLPARHIREVLRQLLQTLQFLHTACRITFSDRSSAYGMPHGNLTLDSLFVRHTHLAGVDGDRQFFVHVADLVLWEHLIYPPSSAQFYEAVATSAQDLGEMNQDLNALGRIGFELAGGTVDPHSKEVIGLHDPAVWKGLQDQPLHDYLCRLIGDGIPFKSVDGALQTLRTLPHEMDTTRPDMLVATEEETLVLAADSRGRRWGFLLILLGLVGLVAIAVSFCSRTTTNPQIIHVPEKDEKEYYLAAVDVPLQPLQYWTEDDGAWVTVLQRSIGVYGDRPPVPSDVTPTPLMDEIAYRTTLDMTGRVVRDGLEWNQRSASFASRDQILAHIQASPYHVGLMRASPDLELENVKAHTIAHEGLAILVPLTDRYPDGNVPDFLNNGVIKVEDLRDLYTRPLLTDIEFHDRPIDLYFPKEIARGTEETIAVFYEKVLDNDPELMQRFDQLRSQAIRRDIKAVRDAGAINLNNNLYELMLHRYETEGRIAIGFDRFSNAVGQCSTYPLAVGAQDQTPRQPFQQSNNKPIDINTDLCSLKGSYFAAPADDYPLRYDLVMVHQASSPFGEMLANVFLNKETQYLFGEVGLVPTKAIDKIHEFTWSQAEVPNP